MKCFYYGEAAGGKSAEMLSTVATPRWIDSAGDDEFGATFVLFLMANWNHKTEDLRLFGSGVLN